MEKNTEKKLPENAKKALELIEEIEKHSPSEVGNYEQTKNWIQQSGVVEDRFVSFLEEKKRELKTINKK